MFKHSYVLYFMIVLLLSVGFSYGIVDKTQPWLPLQQIALNNSTNISVDEDGDGIIDDAEKLGGLTKDSFLKVNGDTLKGVLFLYYGIGKIVDLDSPLYYVDPSYKSNFNLLCVDGRCLNRWEDIEQYITINESLVRSIVEEEIYLREGNLNVNSSLYAHALIGIDTNKIQNLLYLERYCLGGDCLQGINASTLKGYTVGNKTGDIPIIDPTQIYYDLNVGYALLSEESMLSNNTRYVGNLSSRLLENHILSLLNDVHTINISLDDLKESNKTLWEVLDNLTQLIGDEEKIVLNGLGSSDVVSKIVRLMEENNFLRLPSSCYEGFIFMSREDDNLVIECKDEDYIEDKAQEVIKGELCSDGILQGFDDSSEKVCVSYATLRSKIEEYLLSQGFVKKSDLDNLREEILGEIDNRLENQNHLPVPSQRWRCGEDKVLVYYRDNGGVWKTKCREIDIEASLDLDGEVGGITSLGASIEPYKGEDNTKYTFECPPGYVMTGITVQYEDVISEGGMFSDKDAVVHKINIICKKPEIDIYVFS